jgi:hypothetical protein
MTAIAVARVQFGTIWLCGSAMANGGGDRASTVAYRKHATAALSVAEHAPLLELERC